MKNATCTPIPSLCFYLVFVVATAAGPAATVAAQAATGGEAPESNQQIGPDASAGGADTESTPAAGVKPAAESEALPAPPSPAPLPAEAEGGANASPRATATDAKPTSNEVKPASAEVKPASAEVKPTSPEIESAPAPGATGHDSADAGEEPPPQTPLLPLTVTGSFFSRYELREGYERIGKMEARFREMDAVAYRARLGLATSPQEVTDCLSALVQFTPQASGFWQAGGLSDAELGLHEGYLRLKSCRVRIDAGRFEMVYGDHLVIGNVGWHQTGRSFDGARLRLGTTQDRPWVDLFFTLSSEGLPDLYEPIGAGDLYFTGAYAGLGPLLDDGFDLDIYALTHVWPATDVPESAPGAGDGGEGEAAAELTLGTRLKKRVGIIDMRAEGGVQLGARRAAPDQVGEAVSVVAFQVDAEAGLNLLDDRLRIAGAGLYASGDDPDTDDRDEGYNQLYPTAHKFLGFADIIGGRSNVAGPIARVGLKLPHDIALKLDGHFFFRPADRATTAPDGTVSTIDSGYSATEIDTSLVYGIGKGLKLRGMYALFLPSSDQFPSTDPVHYLEVELRYDVQ